jgi:hypothetical protein
MTIPSRQRTPLQDDTRYLNYCPILYCNKSRDLHAVIILLPPSASACRRSTVSIDRGCVPDPPGLQSSGTIYMDLLVYFHSMLERTLSPLPSLPQAVKQSHSLVHLQFDSCTVLWDNEVRSRICFTLSNAVASTCSCSCHQWS